jgi:hypothetical protein
MLLEGVFSADTVQASRDLLGRIVRSSDAFSEFTPVRGSAAIPAVASALVDVKNFPRKCAEVQTIP